MPDNLETDFELDLDQVFGPGVARAEAQGQESPLEDLLPAPLVGDEERSLDSKSGIPDKKSGKVRRLKSKAAKEHEDSDEPAGDSMFRPDRLAEKQKPLGRRFQKPSQVVAAGVAQQAALAAGTPRSSNATSDLEAFEANKAQAVLAAVNVEDDFKSDPIYIGRVLKYVLITALVGAVVYMLTQLPASNVDKLAKEQGPVAKPILERQEKARITLNEYLSKVSPEDRASLVIDGEKLLPVMEAFYKSGGSDPDVETRGIQALPPRQIGQETYFTFVLQQRGARPPVRATLKETLDDKYLLDWMTFADPSAQKWKEFVTKKPAEAVELRCEVKASATYAAPYTAEEYTSYELANASGEFRLQGYAKKSERVAQSLVEKGATTTSGAILSLFLKYEASATSPNQVRIMDLGDSWTVAAGDSISPLNP
jgi:hypothetical protein